MTQPLQDPFALPKGSIVGGSLTGSPPGWTTASEPSSWATINEEPSLSVGYDGTAPAGTTGGAPDPSKWGRKPLGPGGDQVTLGATSGTDPKPTSWIKKTN